MKSFLILEQIFPKFASVVLNDFNAQKYISEMLRDLSNSIKTTYPEDKEKKLSFSLL